MTKKKRIARNEYGQELNRNCYAPSIVQSDLTRCFLCGRTNEKLDFHEIFGGANRNKSKIYGLYVALCHSGCHLGAWGVHYNADAMAQLHREGQEAAQEAYGWTTDEFIQRFGKSYL